MKRKFNLRGKVSLSLLVLSAVLFSQCQKQTQTEAFPSVKIVAANKVSVVASTSASAIDISSGVIQLDGGYCFKLKKDLGTTGDSDSQPTVSIVRVFENGVELNPAHSVHTDIRNLGKGRFSHWGNILYFSASDNSDPRTNGRKYTYMLGGSIASTTNSTTTTTTSTSSNTPIGYATVNGMTTGGAGGQTVTATTLSALRGYASSSLPLIIQVSGTITGTGSVLVKSNKTIVGLSGATLNGVGLRLHGSGTTDYVKNIIVQNLKIRSVIAIDPATGGVDNDCIGIKYADHIWVDHCELSADLDHSDWEYYDGLIDISKQSSYITVSWSKLMNSWKGSGVGGSSDAGLGKLRITYHHNLFNNLAERGPAYGYGVGHVFNNYFLKSANASGYAVAARFGAILLVENNYFENISNPIRTDIDLLPGFVLGAGSNIFKSCGILRISTIAPSYTPEYEYKSALHATADVPAVVLAGAGAK